jgi:hypothetical protein
MEARKMSIPCKFEGSLLSHDEFETIRLTHHPAIYNIESAELEVIRSRLRKMRAKEQTLSRQKRREARGKRGARGASFPGTAERPSQRKQVFAAALKRINKELERLHNLAARTAQVEAARPRRVGLLAFGTGSRPASSREFHSLSLCRSYSERRHGAASK